MSARETPKPPKKPKAAPAKKAARNKKDAPKRAAKAATIGRPSLYSEALAFELFQRLSEGETLKGICRDEHMPHRVTVYRWAEEHAAFRNILARARENQAFTWAEDSLEIAKDADRANGDPAWVQSKKLQCEQIRWWSGRLLSRIFGDKVQQEITGANGGAIKTEAVTTLSAEQEDAVRRIAEIRAAVQGKQEEK